MFTLDQVVPWGRSFAEYQQLFALSTADLEGRILGCGDGPAAFNAEADAPRHTRRLVRSAVCVQPGRDRGRGSSATCDTVLEQTRRNADQFVWGHGIASIDELGEVRMRAMRMFLEDYDAGREAGRYVEAGLPVLPFADASFDLALCSHLLFLYSARFDEAFHRASIREMCRVAAEVRVFPLLALDGSRSPFVDACVSEARAAGSEAETVRVHYEFQRGGNEMLRCAGARRPLERGLQGPPPAAHPAGVGGRLRALRARRARALRELSGGLAPAAGGDAAARRRGLCLRPRRGRFRRRGHARPGRALSAARRLAGPPARAGAGADEHRIRSIASLPPSPGRAS